MLYPDVTRFTSEPHILACVLTSLTLSAVWTGWTDHGALRHERAQVALVPGDAFGIDSCLRISYAASMDTLTEALDRVCAALAPGKFTRT